VDWFGAGLLAIAAVGTAVIGWLALRVDEE
jgi:hypothetical protein